MDAQILHELFDYNDGFLYWKTRTNYKIKIGSKAGCVNLSDGYSYIGINKKKYAAHRLIYLMHYGCLPDEVDHIDGNTLNNSISNLRPATRSENTKNAKKRHDNKSGVKGICWNKKQQKWHAYLQSNKKNYFLGYFDSIQDASNALIIAREKHHKEFARRE